MPAGAEGVEGTLVGSSGGKSGFVSGFVSIGGVGGSVGLLPAAGLTIAELGELLGAAGSVGGAGGLSLRSDGDSGAASLFISGSACTVAGWPGKFGGPGGAGAGSIAVSALPSGVGGMAGADVGGKPGAARSGTVGAEPEGAVGGAGGPLFAASSGGAFGFCPITGGGSAAQPLGPALGGAAGLPPNGMPPDSDVAVLLTAGSASAGLVAFR